MLLVFVKSFNVLLKSTKVVKDLPKSQLQAMLRKYKSSTVFLSHGKMLGAWDDETEKPESLRGRV